MSVRLYREYQLKYYLNASHFIVINGKNGEVHPHTWEFTLNIRITRSSFTEFGDFEKAINRYLAPYQRQLLNEIPPFDTILPTLENLVDYFAGEFQRVLEDLEGELLRIAASETPTRSYILTIPQKSGSFAPSEKVLGDVVDAVLDEVLA